MLLDIMKKGVTDRSVELKIIDSTDGTPETGVAYNTSGIDLWYRRQGAAKVSITEATLSALTDAHSDGGILHISDGVYRLDLPDAAFATGANWVAIGGTVTGMIVIGGRVKLVDIDLEDTVRAGLTALPNVASGSAGAVITSGTGTAQLSVTSGVASANVSQINGSAGAAQKLDRGVRGTVVITVGSASTTTSVIASSISPTGQADGQFLGKVMTFDDNTTTAQLRGQSTVITAYTNGTSAFTVNALTVAPSSGDTATVS